MNGELVSVMSYGMQEDKVSPLLPSLALSCPLLPSLPSPALSCPLLPCLALSLRLVSDYGVPTISRLLNIIGLFCKRAL